MHRYFSEYLKKKSFFSKISRRSFGCRTILEGLFRIMMKSCVRTKLVRAVAEPIVDHIDTYGHAELHVARFNRAQFLIRNLPRLTKMH